MSIPLLNQRLIVILLTLESIFLASTKSINDDRNSARIQVLRRRHRIYIGYDFGDGYSWSVTKINHWIERVNSSYQHYGVVMANDPERVDNGVDIGFEAFVCFLQILFRKDLKLMRNIAANEIISVVPKLEE